MKVPYLLILASLLVATEAGFGQFGGEAGGARGGASGGGGVYQSYRPNSPAQLEREKRSRITSAESKDDGTSTYIDASVLMNVKPDEYVAVFGIVEEASTVLEANAKMDATISHFKDSLKTLGVKDSDLDVDFVIQNRVYGYRLDGNVAKEELVGFEIKKNVAIRFKGKDLLDQLARAAAPHGIYDLVKVDCVVHDSAAIQAKLRAEAASVIKSKADRYRKELGVKLIGPVQVLADSPSIYYFTQQYDSYTAAETQQIDVYLSNYSRIGARRSRTFYFNPLTADGFDTVINPVIVEPVVQFTFYTRVRFEAPDSVKRLKK
jgi:uncharacterized protein YggE